MDNNNNNYNNNNNDPIINDYFMAEPIEEWGDDEFEMVPIRPKGELTTFHPTAHNGRHVEKEVAVLAVKAYMFSIDCVSDTFVWGLTSFDGGLAYMAGALVTAGKERRSKWLDEKREAWLTCSVIWCPDLSIPEEICI
jgi:hypothetical protein